MKYTLRAAIAALSIGSIPPAMAGEGASNANTVFTEIPGMIAHTPAETAPGLDAVPAAPVGADQHPVRPWRMVVSADRKYLNQRAG